MRPHQPWMRQQRKRSLGPYRLLPRAAPPSLLRIACRLQPTATRHAPQIQLFQKLSKMLHTWHPSCLRVSIAITALSGHSFIECFLHCSLDCSRQCGFCKAFSSYIGPPFCLESVGFPRAYLSTFSSLTLPVCNQLGGSHSLGKLLRASFLPPKWQAAFVSLLQ